MEVVIRKLKCRLDFSFYFPYYIVKQKMGALRWFGDSLVNRTFHRSQRNTPPLNYKLGGYNTISFVVNLFIHSVCSG
jgi:hypothetical protein